MPHSVVINFTPIANIPVGYSSGKHLHALFLNLVNSVDQELAEYFHDSQTNKSFTVSPLQINFHHKKDNFLLQWQHYKSIKSGTSCWFRVTLLDDSLFGKLTKLWLNLNPQKPFHLGSANLLITSVLVTPDSHSWANACSYNQIYEEASDSERIIRFNFATPIAFRQGKCDRFLPTVDLVFSSLLRRWKKHSNIEFDEVDFSCLFPSFFDINTEIISDKKSKFIGCVGKISYKIFSQVEPLQIKQINALANYAFYCGLGRKTTMGFGMVKRE